MSTSVCVVVQVCVWWYKLRCVCVCVCVHACVKAAAVPALDWCKLISVLYEPEVRTESPGLSVVTDDIKRHR